MHLFTNPVMMVAAIITTPSFVVFLCIGYLYAA